MRRFLNARNPLYPLSLLWCTCVSASARQSRAQCRALGALGVQLGRARERFLGALGVQSLTAHPVHICAQPADARLGCTGYLSGAYAQQPAAEHSAEPWSDSLTANPGQRLTVPDSLTALTALSLTV